MSASNKRIIAKYYTRIYSVNDVRVFVAAGLLTPQEFAEITGEAYDINL